MQKTVGYRYLPQINSTAWISLLRNDGRYKFKANLQIFSKYFIAFLNDTLFSNCPVFFNPIVRITSKGKIHK